MIVFDAPIREFATKKAAEKFARRVDGAVVEKSPTSAFDMYWPKGKPVYQVVVR